MSRRRSISSNLLSRYSFMIGAISALFAANLSSGQSSTPITLTFEGLQNDEPVLTYYAGGFGGFGSGPGPNYGITFGSDALAVISQAAGGTGNFDNNPSGVTTVSFVSGSGVIMNVSGGFTNGFSFYYASGNISGSVTVYDGPNATGNLLATVNLAATGQYCDPNYQYSCWTTQGVQFGGIAQSVDFSGAANGIGFDNITLGSSTPGSGSPPPSNGGPVLTVTPFVTGSTTTLVPQILTQTVTVTNTGGPGTFSASITPNCPTSTLLVVSCPASGFSIQPTSGTIGGAGSTTNLTVSFNTFGVPPGVYSATYTATSTSSGDGEVVGVRRPARNLAPRQTGSSNQGTATDTVNGVLQSNENHLTFNLTSAQPRQTQSFLLVEASPDGFVIPFDAAYAAQQGNPVIQISPTSADTPVEIEVTASVGSLAPGQTATGTIGVTCTTNAPCQSALNIPVTVIAPGPTTVTKVLPDFGVGASFVTDFYVVNSGTSSANFAINFHDGNGNPVAVPFANIGGLITLSGTIPAGGSGFYEAGTPTTNPPIFGSAIVTSDPNITIQAVLRRLGSDGSYYEAAVPAAIPSNEIEVPFDATIFSGNGSQIYTGLAIANTDPTNTANVSCTARNSQGAIIPGAISVPQLGPLGQWAEYMFPAVEGQRGTFDCTSNTLIGAIATRALGTNALSSLPVISLPNSSSGTRIIPDFGVGASFVTDFYVINSGIENANFSITFQDGNGNPIAVPFSSGSLFTLSGSIPAGGSGFYEAGTPTTNPPIFGSALVTSDPNITIQAVLRRLGSDGSYYEAAVPASIPSNEIEVPFDATIFSGNGSQIYTGLAIANADSTSPAIISCTARNSQGTVIPDAISVPQLNPLGQWAEYMFPAVEGQRGTFDCTSNTLIGAIATRALGTNALSSLPVISQ